MRQQLDQAGSSFPGGVFGLGGRLFPPGLRLRQFHGLGRRVAGFDQTLILRFLGLDPLGGLGVPLPRGVFLAEVPVGHRQVEPVRGLSARTLSDGLFQGLNTRLPVPHPELGHSERGLQTRPDGGKVFFDLSDPAVQLRRFHQPGIDFPASELLALRQQLQTGAPGRHRGVQLPDVVFDHRQHRDDLRVHLVQLAGAGRHVDVLGTAQLVQPARDRFLDLRQLRVDQVERLQQGVFNPDVQLGRQPEADFVSVQKSFVRRGSRQQVDLRAVEILEDLIDLEAANAVCFVEFVDLVEAASQGGYVRLLVANLKLLLQ